MTPDDDERNGAPRPIHLGLQGGGAHGALTWGVLDRLLGDGRLAIRAVSGTSAGAMNAVVLADGLARGGNEGARVALAQFWRSVSDAARLSPMKRGLWERLRGRYSLEGSPGYLFMDGLARLFPPQALNPLGLNPLRDILVQQVDFDRVNAGPVKVYVAATEVGSGTPRIFGPGDLTADAVMASACLPQLYAPVEIDGVAYWDGEFVANPALHPLVEAKGSHDILIVQINPARRPTPRSARAILDRVTEIGFNAGLVNELATIARAERQGTLRGLRLHRIDATAGMVDLAASGRLDAEWDHLMSLFERGRTAAEEWLATDLAAVGHASTLDLAPFEARATRRRFRWPFGGTPTARRAS